MTPETILTTIRAVAEATTELFRYLQTPAGQKSLEKALENQEKAEQFLRSAGNWFETLLTGKL